MRHDRHRRRRRRIALAELRVLVRAHQRATEGTTPLGIDAMPRQTLVEYARALLNQPRDARSRDVAIRQFGLSTLTSMFMLADDMRRGSIAQLVRELG